jgi:hypothetical protein
MDTSTAAVGPDQAVVLRSPLRLNRPLPRMESRGGRMAGRRAGTPLCVGAGMVVGGVASAGAGWAYDKIASLF